MYDGQYEQISVVRFFDFSKNKFIDICLFIRRLHAYLIVN